MPHLREPKSQLRLVPRALPGVRHPLGGEPQMVAISHLTYTEIIVALKDVLILAPLGKLFKPSTMSGSKFHAIRNSSTWAMYELNQISEEECYAMLCDQQFPELTPEAIQIAVTESLKDVRINYSLLDALQNIKAQSEGENIQNGRTGRLRVIGVANISLPEWTALRSRRHWKIFWDLFDTVLTSWMVGARMPDLAFFEHVETALHLDPSTAIFIALESELVLAARAGGMKGLHFEHTKETVRQLLNTFGEPVQRGNDFLMHNAKKMISVTEAGVTAYDNFSQLLIADLTGREDLSMLTVRELCRSFPEVWAFLQPGTEYPLERLPGDVGTTVLAFLTLKLTDGITEDVMEAILSDLTVDGLAGAHIHCPDFYGSHPSIADPVTCVNVLRLFYRHGRGSEVHKTFEYVMSVFWNRAYVEGTPLFPHPEMFLYFLTRFIVESPDKYELYRLIPNMEKRLQEFIGWPKDALGLALKALSLEMLKIDSRIYTAAIKKKQCEDGGWDADIFCTYGTDRVRLGNRGVATAFAVKALGGCMPREPEKTQFLQIDNLNDRKLLEELEEEIRGFEVMEESIAEFAVSGDIRLAVLVNENAYESGLQLENDIRAFVYPYHAAYYHFVWGQVARLRKVFWHMIAQLKHLFDLAMLTFFDAVDAGNQAIRYVALHDWMIFLVLGPVVSVCLLGENLDITYAFGTVLAAALYADLMVALCLYRPDGLFAGAGHGPIARCVGQAFDKETYTVPFLAICGSLARVSDRTRGYFFAKVQNVGEGIKSVGEKVVALTPPRVYNALEEDEEGEDRMVRNLEQEFLAVKEREGSNN